MNIVVVYNTEKGKGFYPYTYNHILSLRRQLERVGHELTVIGYDRDIERHGFAGWWSKMLIFAPEYKDLRPMLALDLDNFIFKTLDPILSLDPTKLWLIRQFLARTDLAEMGLCVVPNAPLSDVIWERAERDPQERQPGQMLREFPHEFMVDVVDGIYSYKRDCKDGKPDDARAVLFHGNPKPPLIEGWAKDWWDQSLAS